MKNKTDLSAWQQTYNNLFIGIVLVSLLAVMAASFGQGYEHIGENFFQREFLLRYFTRLKITMGNRVFTSGVLVGENGWLEFTGGGNIDEYQKVAAFSNRQLKSLESDIRRISILAVKNNIEILIVPAPDKPTIYPDQMPSQIMPIGEQTRLDQFIEFFPAQPNIQVLDLRPAFNAAREEQDVYFKTDTHWNYAGAYIAYREIITTLAEKYPELHALPHEEIQYTEAYVQRDLARMLIANDMKELTLRVNKPAFVKSMELQDQFSYNRIAWIPGSSAPIALVYHDSFGDINLNDLLQMSFGETHFVHHKGFKFRSLRALEYIQPNVIIIEIVERNLGNLPDILSGFAEE